MLYFIVYTPTNEMYWVVDLFQIPCLGLCPLSTNWKILLISLTKYAISGQSDMEADLLPDL